MSDSEEDWNEVEESQESDQKCSCLFCKEVQLSADDTLAHCSVQHSIDLLKYKRSLGGLLVLSS